MYTPILEFRFDKLRLEIIYEETVYSYKDDRDLFFSLFYAARRISDFRDTEDQNLQKMYLQQIRDSLSSYSEEQKEYHEDPDDLPNSFFTELSRTIYMANLDRFTNLFKDEDVLFYAAGYLAFDPVIGQSYPLLPIVSTLEVELCYAMSKHADHDGKICSSKKRLFIIF